MFDAFVIYLTILSKLNIYIILKIVLNIKILIIWILKI